MKIICLCLNFHIEAPILLLNSRKSKCKADLKDGQFRNYQNVYFCKMMFFSISPTLVLHQFSQLSCQYKAKNLMILPTGYNKITSSKSVTRKTKTSKFEWMLNYIRIEKIILAPILS